MFDRLIKFSWLLPTLATLIPLGLLLLGRSLNALGLNGLAVRPIFWLFFVSAPFVGLQTIMVLKVQGNLSRGNLRQRSMLCAAVSAGAAMVGPIWLGVAYVLILKPDS